MSKLAIVKEATAAWNYLQGIICVYKPRGVSAQYILKEIKKRLCQDLNSMEVREPQPVVQFCRIEGFYLKSTVEVCDSGKEVVGRIKDGPDMIQIVKGPSFADHPLVVGLRYQPQDVKLTNASYLGRDSSGLALVGVMSEGIRIGERLRQSKWVRSYIVSGRFGVATDSQFLTGKIVEKSTYHHIKKYFLDRLLSSSQASHQRTMFQAAGVQLNSQRAYELASQGLVRPESDSEPIIYSLKCVKFDLPDFEIEVQVVNENEDYFKNLIHQFGLRLRSTATCTKIRCIKYGPFTLENALLKKHWDLENILANLSQVSKVLKTTDTWIRDPIVLEQSRDGSSSNTRAPTPS